MPTGFHNGRLIFYVFGRYPADLTPYASQESGGRQYPLVDLVLCHGDFLNADHEYIHENKSVKGFGTYGDIMIRESMDSTSRTTCWRNTSKTVCGSFEFDSVWGAPFRPGDRLTVVPLMKVILHSPHHARKRSPLCSSGWDESPADIVRSFAVPPEQL